MAAGIEKLTALKVARLSKPGRYADGKGLYLQITKALVKSWIFRYERDGKERYMGLGATHTVGLAEAREQARDARMCLSAGKDPLGVRNALVVANKAEQLNNLDFDRCVADYIQSHKEAWKSQKHQKQWEASLSTYASPHLGKLYVRRIDTPLVLKVLQPIWKTKTETASRIRERMERVLSWAAKQGYREGENPARWHGHLEELLPKPAKLKNVRHHPALPYVEAGAFFEELRLQKGIGARALELTVLTACRTSEVLGAKWDEVDFKARVWVVPPERMKNGKEHRIPLVDAALSILGKLCGVHPLFVFPGAREDKPLSSMSMLTVLRRMNRADLTVHGFRSTFRDWAAEITQYPKELAELSLAHTVGNAVENAYRRSDLFERRRALMQDWASWCSVVPSDTDETSGAGGESEIEGADAAEHKGLGSAA